MSIDLAIYLLLFVSIVSFVIGYKLGIWKQMQYQVTKFYGKKGTTIPKGTQVESGEHGKVYATVKEVTIK